MSTPTTTTRGWSTTDLTLALRATVRGDVVTAGDPSFPAAAFGVDLTPGRGPEVVVIAADAQDVAAVARLASAIGRRVRTTSGPADARPAGGPSVVPAGTILVVTRLLTGVRVDATRREVTAGVGAGWREVFRVVAPLGLGLVRDADRPSGRAAAADPTRSAIAGFEVVTADGSVRRLRAGQGTTDDRERFAALAAGAGSYGVVTAITLRLTPLPHPPTSTPRVVARAQRIGSRELCAGSGGRN